MCNEALEYEAHVFRDCSISKHIWRGSQLGIQVDNDSIIPITAWLHNWINLLHSHGAAEQFLIVVWEIWKHRNACLFQGHHPDPTLALEDIQETFNRLPAVQRVMRRPSVVGVTSAPPPTEFVTGCWQGEAQESVFMDGSWGKNMKAGIGVVVYVRQQRIVQGAIPCNAENAFMTELIALEEGIQLALSTGLTTPTFHTDCLSLVSLFNSLVPLLAEAEFIFLKCQSMLNAFARVCIKKVSRDDVAESHALANYAHQCLKLERVLNGTSVAGVQVTETAGQVVLENGIVQVNLSVPEGFVTAIEFGGLDNLLEISNKPNNRGYWDIDTAASIGADSNDIALNEIGLTGTSFKIISQTKDKAEISFLCPHTQSLPLQVDKRFVMLRGSSGFYSYAIFKREKGWPSLGVSQIRAVYKPRNDKFHYMAVSDKIQRIMPTPQDRETGEPLAYKEAVLLTNPRNPNLKGEVDDKYQYASEDKDNKVAGWISFDPPIGIWVITPSDEARLAGPVKRDLTAHVGPTLLSMFHSTHYAGKDVIMSFKDGEPWTKVLGPFFVHCNTLSGKQDPKTLWQRAKDQMVEEVKSWPYDFVLSQDFLKANQRGSISGRLLVNDRSKSPIPAGSAWVGLAPPGDVGSWQTEMKGYQFWTQADADGRFLIKNINVGKYSVYAWVPGFIGDFKSPTDVIVRPGEEINVADVYTPPRVGPTIWEIGIPDRSAAEFFVPDPSPNLTNRLFLHDQQNKYRQYGLWDRYSEVYPENDLTYTVGVSDFHKDWFFAQVVRRRGSTYKPTTWKIVFPIKAVTANTNYTLQIALASATQSELQVRINNPDMKAQSLFTTNLIGRDNAIARHGIHGLYRLFTVNVPSSILQTGNNTIFLTQSRYTYIFSGVMYDYIRLEGPPHLYLSNSYKQIYNGDCQST